ncbi:hypothetical protein BT96DRAFT_1027417 [Gymnopus androsaceus JB14]|uniref:Uncharacterized protein n=1 Tax=Gymnopus androsaceus JB14 TaxID=1447944 RepID=A0A6A4GBY1_9AGAR|nr:hypothetical protein BT96DRAFT_1027417 [Gymnopus androsaceus JB14]
MPSTPKNLPSWIANNEQRVKRVQKENENLTEQNRILRTMLDSYNREPPSKSSLKPLLLPQKLSLRPLPLNKGTDRPAQSDKVELAQPAQGEYGICHPHEAGEEVEVEAEALVKGVGGGNVDKESNEGVDGASNEGVDEVALEGADDVEAVELDRLVRSVDSRLFRMSRSTLQALSRCRDLSITGTRWEMASAILSSCRHDATKLNTLLLEIKPEPLAKRAFSLSDPSLSPLIKEIQCFIDAWRQERQADWDRYLPEVRKKKDAAEKDREREARAFWCDLHKDVMKQNWDNPPPVSLGYVDVVVALLPRSHGWYNKNMDKIPPT